MEHILDKPLSISSFKPRKAFTAFLFSLLIPGLGQIYNGQIKKGITFLALPYSIPFLFGLTGGTTTFYGFVSLMLILLAIRIYVVVDGVIIANQQKQYTPKNYNTWYYYLLIALVMYAVHTNYNLTSALGTQTFDIPITSNYPTIQLNDAIVADMRAYKHNGPDYGDIVVYTDTNEQMYTFRIVGRPNDKLELNNNIVTINGKPSKATFIKETISEGIAVSEFEEELPNGHKHLIYKAKQSYDSTKTNSKGIVVPPDSYYVLGDNRDNAADSRYTGFVSKDRIIGRILYSYWGETTDRINVDFRDK
ncbi:signal peptidase I [Telluribacter sp.]|jgi:signal peptidase I|uniref:signal peptidase I n=1 Tax=Telluribacter sp. TaxID=1978767 RepID=UPI002E15F185|nr:signal peptidase I [Telluribacter sp.]